MVKKIEKYTLVFMRGINVVQMYGTYKQYRKGYSTYHFCYGGWLRRAKIPMKKNEVIEVDMIVRRK